MLLLAIDTAGPACAVAILRDSEVLAGASVVIGKGHAERLMPMFEASLGDASIAFKDLERIAVTTGPGSFTGVRVGVAAARGLALALGIPAVGIGSLNALAFPFARMRQSGTLVAVLDARRGEVYALAKDLESGETIFPATAARAEAIVERLEGAARPLVLVGASAAILEAAPTGAVTAIATPEYPEIVDVGRLGLLSEVQASPVPLYIRGADAKPQSGKAIAHR